MSKLAIALASIALLTACGGKDPDPSPASDPYEDFLELAPPDAPDLTRDDAQLRAMLGCETDWAPYTTDWALQQAYGELVC